MIKQSPSSTQVTNKNDWMCPENANRRKRRHFRGVNANTDCSNCVFLKKQKQNTAIQGWKGYEHAKANKDGTVLSF